MSSSPPVAEVRRPLAPRLIVSFIAALSMLVGPLAFAPANAATFTVQGVVSGQGDGPLEGLSVELQVYDTQDEDFKSDDWARTDVDGAYAFEDVEAATYRVVAHGEDDFITAYSAEFDLTANFTVPAMVLEVGGSMSGVVIDATSTDPIEYASVEAFPFDGETIDYSFDYRTSTDADGAFLLQGLPEGDFKVEISDNMGNHVTEYYDSASTVASAETVPVEAEEVTPLRPITLDAGGSFTGSVNSEGGGLVENPFVHAMRMVDGEADYENAYSGQFDDDGNYTIVGLPAGDYKISFSANSYEYFEEYYDDQPTIDTADVLTIDLGQTRALGTTSLEKTASVSGMVENAEGEGLGDILVAAYPVVDGVVAPDSAAYIYTENDGTFDTVEVKALHAGTYRLVVRDGLHRYEEQTTSDFKIEGGEAKVMATFVLTLAPAVDPPVVPPVIVPPTQPAPPVVGPPAPVAKKAASISISAKGAKKKATLTITVKASGVTPTGKITIKLGGKTLKNVQLKNGKAKVTLTKQKKGKRAYKVIYAGDSRVNAKTVTSKKVTIK